MFRRNALAAAASFFIALPAFADDEPTPPPPAETAPVATVEARPASWFDTLSVNAFVSAGYTLNLGSPKAMATGDEAPPAENQLRVFDRNHASIMFDVGEVVVQRPVASRGDVGFRIDLEAGSTIPHISAAAGLSTGDFDLQQAMVSYIAPVGRGLRLDAGKFVTFAGAEVIEGYDGWNDNYSRSFLFGYAIPFTHTGLRAAISASDALAVTAMIVNGWDNAVDNNHVPSFGVQIALTPAPLLTVYAGYIGGREVSENDGPIRHLVDVVAILKPVADLALTGNFDYGKEGDTKWYGVAGVARFDATRSLSLALRGEYFADPDGVRTGLMGGQNVMEVTLTPTLRVGDHLAFRLEGRLDHSSEKVFLTDGENKATQVTIAANSVGYF